MCSIKPRKWDARPITAACAIERNRPAELRARKYDFGIPFKSAASRYCVCVCVSLPNAIREILLVFIRRRYPESSVRTRESAFVSRSYFLSLSILRTPQSTFTACRLRLRVPVLFAAQAPRQMNCVLLALTHERNVYAQRLYYSVQPHAPHKANGFAAVWENVAIACMPYHHSHSQWRRCAQRAKVYAQSRVPVFAQFMIAKQKNRVRTKTHTYLRYRRHHLQAAQSRRRRKRLAAGNRVAGTETGDERTADHQIADGQKDDRPLRVAKARRIDEEREHLEHTDTKLGNIRCTLAQIYVFFFIRNIKHSTCTHREQTAGAAEGGPRAHPVAQHRSLVLRKEHCMAWSAAVFLLLPDEHGNGIGMQTL